MEGEQKQDVENPEKEHLCSDDKLWKWYGKGFKRNGKGRAKKEFFRSIKRQSVIISVSIFRVVGTRMKRERRVDWFRYSYIGI